VLRGQKVFFTTLQAEIKIARAAALAEAELYRRIIPVPCGEMEKRSLRRSRHRKHEHHEREVLMHLVFMPQKPFVRSRPPGPLCDATKKNRSGCLLSTPFADLCKQE
jgi:hypothetical protein